VIELAAMTARSGRVALSPITQRIEPGRVVALLGTPADGVALVLAAIAGREAVRSGTIDVMGARAGAAAARRLVAYVPIDARLPDALRVDEALRVAREVRGEPPQGHADRLGALGVAPLERRAVRTLSAEEVRAVALAEAVTSTAARVILVDEPYVTMDPRAVPLVAKALRARAAAGACVVVATASPREAHDLAEDVMVFDRGRLVRRSPPWDPVLVDGPRGVLFRLIASDARALASALAQDAAVRRVETDGRVVLAQGELRLPLAEAIARAVKASGVDIELMRSEVPVLDELRAAAAGDVAGAYRAAMDRAQRAAHRPPSSPPPPRPPEPPSLPPPGESTGDAP